MQDNLEITSLEPRNAFASGSHMFPAGSRYVKPFFVALFA